MAGAENTVPMGGPGAGQVLFDPDGSPAPVPSPCVNVCELDAARRGCIGCLRLLGEIAGWGRMTDEEKRAVWRQVLARRLHGMPPIEAP
jgi:hypothetical protein